MTEALLESTTTRGSSALRIVPLEDDAPSHSLPYTPAYCLAHISSLTRHRGQKKRGERHRVYQKDTIKGGVLKRAHTAFMYIRACTRSGRFVAKH